MPRATLRTHVTIDVPREEVFRYVSDLSQHGEWASDSVQILSVEATPQVIGNRYRSTAQSHGVTFHNELVVTEFDPPLRFAFVGQDSTGRVEHVFLFHKDDGSTRVERQMKFDVNLRQWLAYMILLYPIRTPSARKTLQLLKAKLEGASHSP